MVHKILIFFKIFTPEQYLVVYLTSLCVKWAFFGTRGPLKRSLNERVEYNVFFSTNPLKAPNRLKSLKLA
jgi:hypothetical protein